MNMHEVAPNELKQLGTFILHLSPNHGPLCLPPIKATNGGVGEFN